ncbi:MAG TPA: MoaD/ThiS family protein [Dermatophilaceae bacterium]|nr:MoaD/ThiS family protein [Dermatophilaceae bacterium]
MTPASPALVTVRYWASARAAAGVDTDLLPPGTVRDVLAVAADRRPGLAPILAVCSVLVDGRPAPAAEDVPAGTTLEVLPPFAGG